MSPHFAVGPFTFEESGLVTIAAEAIIRNPRSIIDCGQIVIEIEENTGGGIELGRGTLVLIQTATVTATLAEHAARVGRPEPRPLARLDGGRFVDTERGYINTSMPAIAWMSRHGMGRASPFVLVGLVLALSPRLARAWDADVRVTAGGVTLARGAGLTLNGIAQGYMTDKVTEVLNAEGLRHVLAELGETRALGNHPSGMPWRIGSSAAGRPAGSSCLRAIHWRSSALA